MHSAIDLHQPVEVVGDAIDGIASITRDETAKFNEDRVLRKRLAELEAQVAAK